MNKHEWFESDADPGWWIISIEVTCSVSSLRTDLERFVYLTHVYSSWQYIWQRLAKKSIQRWIQNYSEKRHRIDCTIKNDHSSTCRNLNKQIGHFCLGHSGQALTGRFDGRRFWIASLVLFRPVSTTVWLWFALPVLGVDVTIYDIDRSSPVHEIEMRRTRGSPLKCLIVSIWVNSKVSSPSSWWIALTCGSTVCFTMWRSDFFRLLAFVKGFCGRTVVPIDEVETT